MYFSRLKMSISEYVSICNDDMYKLHQYLTNLFSSRNVRFKKEVRSGGVTLYCYSDTQITNEKGIDCKEYPLQMLNGGCYEIACTINPIRQHRENGKKNCIKRAVDTENLYEWVKDKLGQHDISVLDNDFIINDSGVSIHHKHDADITCKWYDIKMVCMANDEAKLKNLIQCGLGSQRSFGYGMILVKKIIA